MKIAFATTDGVNIDEHFGRAGLFTVYELTEEGYSLVEMRKFAEGMDAMIERSKDMEDLHEGLVQDKVDRLSDCRIVYLTQIGGPSAARLVKKGMMPVKVRETVSIESEMRRLLETVRTAPPPWLRKAMRDC